MNVTNWQTFKCRCSGIHKIMANSRSNPQLTEKQGERLAVLEKEFGSGVPLNVENSRKYIEYTELLVKKENSSKIILSDTCIEYLMEVYALETAGIVSVAKELSEVMQMEKGKMVEEDCITLLSVVDGLIYVKNEEIIENDYLRGTPDVFIGEEIMKAEEIIDIKAAFDYPGFLKKINQPLDPAWEKQVQGYCDITKAPKGTVSHCLESMPITMQESLYRQLENKMMNSGEYISKESPSFKKDIERIWGMLWRSMNYEKIPHHKRVFHMKVKPFTNFERNAVYDRVKVCREWLSNFDEQYKKLNLEVGNESVTFESN